MNKTGNYLAIDLKSFYASVECVDRGLDPMTARLVVADPARTEKTICLAVSPGMKALGVKNRCRVFQIPKNINYITAPPRMQLYIDYSARIYGIYLKYFAPEDIHVYSVDEAFMDTTSYQGLYGKDAEALSADILADIRSTYGLYATCGIGTNLYLAKIALDMLAKHADDFTGRLDENSYRKLLWDHKPITDFWMIGKGTAARLKKAGICTMRDVAMADEKLLFRLFGVNAELLMDHAWGIEPVTIKDIKDYRTKSESLSSGQVLPVDYNYRDCLLIVKEMCDVLCLSLIKEHKIASGISLWLGASTGNCGLRGRFSGSETLISDTNSSKLLREAFERLYVRIADPGIYYRRVMISLNNLRKEGFEQMDIFTAPEDILKDRAIQRAAAYIKGRYGKNAILKGMNLEEAGTTVERNAQIGGHRA